VNAYLLVIAAFVVSAGRVGDILGRRRVFLIGGIAAGVLAMNRVLAAAITLAASGAVFQAVLDGDLHAGQVEPEAFTSALSAATWVLVGLCVLGTVLTWAFVRSSDEAGAEPEHQARHHFHLPWVGQPHPSGRSGSFTSS